MRKKAVKKIVYVPDSNKYTDTIKIVKGKKVKLMFGKHKPFINKL